MKSDSLSLARRISDRKASALLLVLWAALFMSLTVLGVVEFVAFGLDETVVHLKDFQARQLAESGLVIGLHPLVQPGDPVLQQEFPNGDRISVSITPEDGRLPINAMLAREQTDALKELFIRWGMGEEDAAILTDSLADWVDSNHTPRLNGAENDYYTEQGYPHYPRNQPFASLDEMLAVRGMDGLALIKPDWRDYFTVYGSGSLNINGASADAIETMLGVSPDEAQALVDYRNGPDGLPNTEDDLRYQSLEQVRAVLGRTPDNVEFSRITVESSVLRVESRGTVGGTTSRRLSVVAETIPGKRPVVLTSMED